MDETVTIMKEGITSTKGRSLTQAEINGFWRFQFCETICSYVREGKVARFAVVGRTSSKTRLVEMSKRLDGEWHFFISGKGSSYTYRFGDFFHVMEKLWDNSSQVICFEDEIQLDFSKPQANPDAEPSLPEEL